MTDAAIATKPPRARRMPMAAEPPPELMPGPPVIDNGPNPTQRVRVPFGTKQQRLDNTPIPGFQCYWFNDTPGRVDRAKRAGYEHVTDHSGNPVREIVGVQSGLGGPLFAYRMKIPLEFYLEDMAAKERPRTETDQQMRQHLKEGGYASEGRPGFPDPRSEAYRQSTVSAQMDINGRQRFNLTPDPQSQS